MKSSPKWLFLLVLFAFVVSPLTASASHSWRNYHWARTSNPFNLRLGDNVSSIWDSYLATTSSDWSVSTVLDTTVVTGGTKPRNCRPTVGQVEVCSSTYGRNGWLGLAQIWVSGDHIAQGLVKVNDTYFNTGTYNTPAWRNLVMCQEVGHTLGLDHQDENFNNPPLGTCMDYTNDPTPNQHPNTHDYAELERIYSHLDETTTVAGMAAAGGSEAFDMPAEWGKPVRGQGNRQSSLFERDFGAGNRLFTFVFWIR